MVCVEKEHIGFNSHATTAITTDQMLFNFQRHHKSIRQMELNAFYVICTLLRFQNCHEALETQVSIELEHENLNSEQIWILTNLTNFEISNLTRRGCIAFIVQKHTSRFFDQ